MKPERFSCRIYGVLRRGDRVLLTRSRFKTREFVNFPGGGVELGEGPMDALRREYHEETGLSIKPLRVCEGRSTWVVSPETTIFVPWPIRVKNIFIWATVVF